MVELVHHVCEDVQAMYPDIAIDRQAVGMFNVWVDPERISEAMTQLVDNACRYSPAGGRVVVELRLDGTMARATSRPAAKDRPSPAA